jgi:phosphoribosylaminoimidazole-succinocarboxamide synthase
MTASIIKNALNNCLQETALPISKKYRGKVRDTYDLGDKLLLITTDRQSAFDRLLAHVPFKGQVLNLTSAWWFEKTEHIVPNHLLVIPDPNVTIAKKCTVFPIEFVVRGYITGTTKTSLWKQYQDGVRTYCGNFLKEGLLKNQPLETPLLTPTTKDPENDRPISPAEIVSEGHMSAKDWEEAANAAMALYKYGAEVAAKHGLILVDTKYEFGKDQNGKLCLIDEIHTPDSSRYWLKETYAARHAEGLEPENIDKEFLRLWFAANCDPYKDQILPTAPEELIITLASRYIQLYQMITGSKFHFPADSKPIAERILQNVAGYLA